ncbi:MAG: SPOR domain-containing protein [Clostridium sp.]|nr:SPOR domain-containing protein [Clostridium sp.]
MRYTRYDYKKKNNNGNILLWLIGTIIVSIIIGISFFNLFLKEGSEEKKENTKVNNTQETNENTEAITKSFGIIQCGVYKNKENAEAQVAAITNEYASFIIEEEGKFKVFAGIFNLDDADKKTEALNAASISSFRVKCNITEDTDYNKAKAEIIDAYIKKVINELEDKSVKSINIKEFKAWVDEIYNNVNEKDEGLDQIENNIKSLPEEYSRENLKESMNFLYNILIKYK